MSNQIDTFWPHFLEMVEKKGVAVTPELERGVKILLENTVTSDNAEMVEQGLNLAPGSATLYTALLEYLSSSDEEDEVSEEDFTEAQIRYADLWNAQATILSMSTPSVGAKFVIVPTEE